MLKFSFFLNIKLLFLYSFNINELRSVPNKTVNFLCSYLKKNCYHSYTTFTGTGLRTGEDWEGF